jgi:four helix bundle suffix protein
MPVACGAYLLDRLIRRLEQDFVKKGGLRERMTAAQLEYRSRGKIQAL